MARRQSTPEEVQAEFVRQLVHAARRLERYRLRMNLKAVCIMEGIIEARREDCRKPVELSYGWVPRSRA